MTSTLHYNQGSVGFYATLARVNVLRWRDGSIVKQFKEQNATNILMHLNMPKAKTPQHIPSIYCYIYFVTTLQQIYSYILTCLKQNIQDTTAYTEYKYYCYIPGIFCYHPAAPPELDAMCPRHNVKVGPSPLMCCAALHSICPPAQPRTFYSLSWACML